MNKIIKIISILVITLTIFSMSGCNNKKDVKDIEKEVEKSIKKGEYSFVIGNDVTNGDAGLEYAYLKKYDAYAVCGIGEHSGGVITIPEKVNGKPVIAISKKAFEGIITLYSVNIPDSVQVILSGAFEGCAFLEQVTVGKNDSDLQYIQNIIFSQTSISSLTYKGSMSEWQNMLKDLPGNYITTWAYNSNSTTISVICNDGTLEYWCNTGKLVEYEKNTESAGLEYALNEDGKSYSVIGIGTCKDKDIIIPSKYNGLPVTKIGEYAFGNCSSLKSVVIPDGLLSIGCSAFHNCISLTSINIPNGILNIDIGVFYGCSSLKSISIPNSVTKISSQAFYNCSALTNVNIPDSVEIIDSDSFGFCTSITNITIPNNVTRIIANPFSGCSALKYNVYDNGYYLGNKNNPYLVFVKAKNTDIISCTVHKNTKFILGSAFSFCNKITSIDIPDGIISIGDGAFQFWVLSTTSPNTNGVYNEYDNGYYLGNNNNPYLVFVKPKNNTDVTSCTIHKNTKLIYGYAFMNSPSINSIVFKGSVKQWNAIIKSPSWDSFGYIAKIICSDGTITLE